MNFQFLGTGNARQVPCYGCECPACVRALTFKNFRRTACSAKIETQRGIVLLDAGQHNLSERFTAGTIHSILLTHYHMDHVQGLFPLRWGKNQLIKVYGPDDADGCDDLYKHPGILEFQVAPAVFEPFTIDELTITPLPLNHSKQTMGFYIKNQHRAIAYLTDTLGLPEATESFLKNKSLDALILDCSYPPIEQPKNHNDLNLALSIIKSLNPDKAYLTHIGHDLDAYVMQHNVTLPENVFFANDNDTLFTL